MYRRHRNSSQVTAIRPLVTLSIDEQGGRTHATAELRWRGSYLAGSGVAYRHPCDHLTRETELATARALSDLAEQVVAPRRIKA